MSDTGPGRGMRYYEAPYIDDLWIVRKSADQAWRTMAEADEMKRNEWDEYGEIVKWNLWQGKTEETPREIY